MIAWSTSKVKVQRTSSSKQRFNRTRDWGSWSQNPFRHFYDQETELARDL
ncbi:hypothetical protein OVS_02160 [Mycoplasma ovis str. Michigan]|uniref:Uncharacterized protein n=1 Tax=Mycoplasma ovis str. Michigan TaxID=1415773 RepID=A0ABM5P1V2_9MOLU|nr:hypothetical protein [Mycoplasma ovis]AHC40293.1 hypothetical protein OVS_02160 [Mycoplasma ovis str. Michigan]